MKPLTLAEAAHFLRMKRSTLYQNSRIPRYRRPGSRALLFDQEELEALIKSGRIESPDEGATSLIGVGELDMQRQSIHHRRKLYR